MIIAASANAKEIDGSAIDSKMPAGSETSGKKRRMIRSRPKSRSIRIAATRVDGVYSEDPERNPHAVLYSELDYNTVRERNLRVMDSTAIAHCMEHNMPILVFNFRKDGNILRAVRGEKVGTRISSKVGAEAISRGS